MDFLDPNKQRNHTLRLFVGYTLVGIAIAIAALILLFQSYGYDVDRHTGQVIQNSLVYVSARPVAASIYLNGKLNSSQTDAKLTIPAGQYSIEIRHNGYRSWKNSVSLDGGQVEHFTYPVLFPNELVTADQQLYLSAPSFAAESGDRHWLLVQQPSALTSFDDFDLTNPKQPPTTVTLPTDLLTAATTSQQLTLVKWANDNRHVLLKHTYDGTDEYVIVDREIPTESVNISKLVASNTISLMLRDGHYDQYYAYDAAAATLGTYDLKTKVLTPLLQKVTSYKSAGPNLVLYTTASTVVGQVQVKIWDGATAYDVHVFPASAKLVMDTAQYGGDWYAVVGPELDGRVYVYKNLQTSLRQAPHKLPVPITILKIDQPAYASFSSNGEFIVAQNGSKFAGYDIETNRRYYYELKQPTQTTQQAIWTDDYRLGLVIDGKTLVFDYDGTNQQTLTANVPGLRPYFSRDYTGLFNVAPSVEVPGRFALTYTSLKAQ
jgi:hypothetical protein